MKKYIILILSLLINILTYASSQSSGNDSHSSLTWDSKIGKMENVITGVSRRKLISSEGIVITLKQKEEYKVENLKIKSLPTRDSVNFLSVPVGKVYDFRYYVEGKEVSVGDTISFPNNSTKMEMKILATYAGYDLAYPPYKTNKVLTDDIGVIKLTYDVPSTGERNKTMNISQLYYETHVIRKVKVDVSGKMDFGQVVAGEIAYADVDVDVYFYKDKSTYEIPDSMNIKNSNGDTLQVNLSSSIDNYRSWDSHSRIKINGRVKTEKNTPSGKYKGSFYVKFRFK